MLRSIGRILVLACVGTLVAAAVRYRVLAADAPTAPELTSTAGWLNTDRPLRLSEELKGHVVLLDFWTYCCINCMHVIPDLEHLEEKYKDEPFVVIGVHTAKFRNEMERESIRNAMFRYGIRHPVVIDSGFSIWNAYGARGWPSFALVGADGKLVPIHNRFGTPLFVVSGEGKREALDQAIAGALDAARVNGLLANKRVEFKLDAAVPSASGLAFPGKVAAAPPRDDAPGYVFIADSSHNRVVIASWPDEAGMSRLAWAIGDGEPALRDGEAGAARFHDPQGLFFDHGARVLYVADTKNHAVRTIDVGALERGEGGPVVGTLVGMGKQVYDREGGKAGRNQGLSSPWDVVMSADRRVLYVAMAGTHQIWSVDLESKVARAFAGSGREDLLDGPAMDAALAQPSGLALSSDGTRLYFADSETSAARIVDLKEGTVNTMVGRGLFDFGDVSNTLARSRFQHCLGVAIWPREDGADRVLVADTYNHKVKVVDLDAGRVSELLGVGRMEDAGSASDLVLDEPGGVCVTRVDGETRLFVADTNNHRVIIADPATAAWRELVIDGLAPESADQPSSRAATRVTLRAASGKALRLRLSPSMPEDADVNPEAPVGIRVWRVREGGAGETVTQRTYRIAAFPAVIDVPGAAIEAGVRLRVEMTFAWCAHDDYGVCTPGEAAWEVTIGEGTSVEGELEGG